MNVTSHMQVKYRNLEGMEFLNMDVRRMDAFGDDSFDIIIDKACLDAVYCGFSSTDDAIQMAQEVVRILKPTGNFVSFSYGPPAARLPYLAKATEKWTIEHTHVVGAASYYAYICTKIDPDASKDE